MRVSIGRCGVFDAYLTVGVLIDICAVFLMSIANSLALIYVAGAMFGIVMNGINTLTVTFFASNWFAQNIRGRLMGVINVGAALAGIIWPPLVQLAISGYGYQVAYVACAVLVALLTLPFTLFVYVRTPEEKGLTPLGYKSDLAVKEDTAIDSVGMSFRNIWKSPPVYFLIIVVVCFACANGFRSNFNGFAAEFLANTGQSKEDIAMVGAFMVSMYSASILIVALVQGWMIDKIGIKITFWSFLVIYLLAFVVWWFFGTSTIGLWIGAFLLGTQLIFLNVGVPLFVRQLYGPKDYSKILSCVLALKGFLGGFSGTVVAFFYDWGGTYHNALLFGMIMVAIDVVCLAVALRYLGKLKWDNKEPSLVEA
jgi:MFS family permease